MRRPLTASLLRAHTETPVSSVPAFNKLFEVASQKLSTNLARLNEVPVRVAVDGIVESIATVKQPHTLSLFLQSTEGPLDALVACDRSFCFTLCELCLGGTGTEPGFDSERPLSKIETQLQNKVLEEFAALIPETLADTFDLKFEAIQPESPLEQAAEWSCIGGKLLVNAFSYSGEVQLLFNRKQLTAIADKLKLNDASMADTKEQTGVMREQLNELELLFKVSLPAEAVAFGSIGEFRPGQLIKLSSTMATPLAASCEGRQLFSALLAKSAGKIAVQVL